MTENKVYGVVWFTLWDGDTIGIVAMNNGFEDKAYIGKGKGLSPDEDVEIICKYGAKFPFDQAIAMTGGKV